MLNQCVTREEINLKIPTIQTLKSNQYLFTSINLLKLLKVSIHINNCNYYIKYKIWLATRYTLTVLIVYLLRIKII